MTLDEIRELIKLASETGVAELEVQKADNRVRIRLEKPASVTVTQPIYQHTPAAAEESALPQDTFGRSNPAGTPSSDTHSG